MYRIHFFVRLANGARVGTGVADSEYVNNNEFSSKKEAHDEAQRAIAQVNFEDPSPDKLDYEVVQVPPHRIRLHR